MKPRYYVALLLGSLLLLCSHVAAQWNYFAPQPSARWGHTCASYGGRLYSVSGLGWNNFEAYNPATNTWQVLAPIPVGVAYAAVSGWNGKIYVMAGYTGSPSTNHQVYDIATNTWSTRAPVPVAAYGIASVAYAGKIYCIGGTGAGVMNNVQIYDVATNTWSTGTPMPTARYEHGIGLIGTKVYAFGGYAGAGTGVCEAYDIPTNSWTTRAPMTYARWIHAGGSDGSLLHAAGGYPMTGHYETYNPATNTWTVRAPLQAPRYRASGAVVNGCFFVPAGYDNVSAMSSNEGFCGFIVLPVRHDLHLQARDIGEGVRVTWTLSTDLSSVNWLVERSLDGHDFEALGSVKGKTEWWDKDPEGQDLWYRLTSLDYTGDQLQSNVAEVLRLSPRDHSFAYFQGPALIVFKPATADAGTAKLWNVEGRLMMESAWSPGTATSELTWSLADLAQGVYVFSYQSAGHQFQRKVVRL